MPTAPPYFRPANQQQRPEQRRGYERERREDQSWRNWYKRKVWISLRAGQLAREPLCENCLIREDLITAADTVHHREPHRGEWTKFIDPENLASVCKGCHDGEISRGERSGWTDRGWQVDGHTIPPRVVQPMELQPSRVPLTMVCGPPGAGKSTYINAHRSEADILIDIDVILSDLSGDTTRTQERRDKYLKDAFIERNRRLAGLSQETRPIAAWFIIGAPQPSAREVWVKQIKPSAVVVFETPLQACRQRILAEQSRTPTASSMINGASTWWDRYDRSPVDTLYL